MIADADVRLGKNGVDEIKQHPFFKGFDWDKVRSKQAPYIPQVTSEISNENFDHFDEEEPFHSENEASKQMRKNRRLDMNFIGYTYKADVEEQRELLVKVLKDLGDMADEFITDEPQRSIQEPNVNNFIGHNMH